MLRSAHTFTTRSVPQYARALSQRSFVQSPRPAMTLKLGPVIEFYPLVTEHIVLLSKERRMRFARGKEITLAPDEWYLRLNSTIGCLGEPKVIDNLKAELSRVTVARSKWIPVQSDTRDKLDAVAETSLQTSRINFEWEPLTKKILCAATEAPIIDIDGLTIRGVQLTLPHRYLGCRIKQLVTKDGINCNACFQMAYQPLLHSDDKLRDVLLTRALRFTYDRYFQEWKTSIETTNYDAIDTCYTDPQYGFVTVPSTQPLVSLFQRCTITRATSRFKEAWVQVLAWGSPSSNPQKVEKARANIAPYFDPTSTLTRTMLQAYLEQVCDNTTLQEVFSHVKTVNVHKILSGLLEVISKTDADTLFDAIWFAVMAHKGQTRKGEGNPPYIVHPIRVMCSIIKSGVTDVSALAAAVLHDTVEDTDTTLEQLTERFGPRIAGIVAEVTDDKTLAKALIKQTQLANSLTMSDEAKMIKLADKGDNLSDIESNPPPSWTPEYKLGYVIWSYAMWLNSYHVNMLLSSKLIPIFTRWGVMDMPIAQVQAKLADWYATM